MRRREPSADVRRVLGAGSLPVMDAGAGAGQLQILQFCTLFPNNMTAVYIGVHSRKKCNLLYLRVCASYIECRVFGVHSRKKRNSRRVFGPTAGVSVGEWPRVPGVRPDICVSYGYVHRADDTSSSD